MTAGDVAVDSQLLEFASHVRANPYLLDELRDGLAGSDAKSAFIEIVRREGFSVSPELFWETAAHFLDSEGELSDSALEQIAGGSFWGGIANFFKELIKPGNPPFHKPHHRI